MRVRHLWILLLFVPSLAPAQTGRSWFQLPTSNGYTGVVVDLAGAKVDHFRDHLFATEEPRWDAEGSEVWQPTEPGGSCHQPQPVFTRDLLYDAYFGIAAGGVSTWLSGLPVALDASGYDGLSTRPGRDGGTGIIRMVQAVPGTSLRVTTRVWAPWALERPAFVMALELENAGAAPSGPIELYGLVNAHLGAGRPGPDQETGTQAETIGFAGSLELVEQGFAGALVVRGLETPARLTHSPAAFYEAVRDGAGDLPLPASTPALVDDAVGAMQWHVPTLAPGARVWAGVLVAYDPDPQALAALRAQVEAFVGGRGSQALWTAERAEWEAFQARVELPEGLSEDEEDLALHSAAVLRMAQVREARAFLRGEVDPGMARFTGRDGEVEAVASGGATREHRGAGAILASLPPGRWTYAWVRDGAYAIVGLVDAGLHAEAREALRFFLDAQADRYRTWQELSGVPLAPYALSLTRYHGFGLEESDTICNGDINVEFDGFGLFLWALAHYVEETGDETLLAAHWTLIRDRIAGVLEGLIEPATGLVAADSSIWEVHWQGKQKHFAYTSITASRGLCDAAGLAARMGDPSAGRLADAGRRIRGGLHQWMRDPSGALAANLEELATGTGYWDAAVIEAVAMGLFAPDGAVAQATLAGLREHLTVPSGTGLFRNDDEHDAHDRSPYGSPYDSQEWVFLDYRASIAARHMGEVAYAEALQDRVRERSRANWLLIAENYDPVSGDYRNNAPMIGFGAGSELTSLRQRSGGWAPDPACGTYFEDEVQPPPPDGGSGSDAGVERDAGAAADGGPPADGGAAADPVSGCGCGAGGGAARLLPMLLALGALVLRRRSTS